MRIEPGRLSEAFGRLSATLFELSEDDFEWRMDLFDSRHRQFQGSGTRNSLSEGLLGLSKIRFEYTAKGIDTERLEIVGKPQDFGHSLVQLVLSSALFESSYNPIGSNKDGPRSLSARRQQSLDPHVSFIVTVI